MICVIHSRANKIIHRAIKDQEIATFARFHIDHFAHHQPSITGNQPPWLNLDLAAQMPQRAFHHRAIIRRQRWVGIAALIRNAKAATQIKTFDDMSVSTQNLRQFRHLLICLLVWR